MEGSYMNRRIHELEAELERLKIDANAVSSRLAGEIATLSDQIRFLMGELASADPIRAKHASAELDAWPRPTTALGRQQ